MIESIILGLHLMSAHLPERPGQNNINPGIYAVADGWTAGTYRNTLRRQSVYFGYQFDAPNTPFSLTIGAVSGYHITKTPIVRSDKACVHRTQGDGCDSLWIEGISRRKWMPMVVPSMHFGPARLWLMPQPSGAVLHLSVEREF